MLRESPYITYCVTEFETISRSHILAIFLFTVNNAIYHDVASGSDITLCNKIDKPLVVYRFSGNIMTSIITLRKRLQNLDV